MIISSKNNRIIIVNIILLLNTSINLNKFKNIYNNLKKIIETLHYFQFDSMNFVAETLSKLAI